jgi:hypothetical protein
MLIARLAIPTSQPDEVILQIAGIAEKSDTPDVFRLGAATLRTSKVDNAVVIDVVFFDENIDTVEWSKYFAAPASSVAFAKAGASAVRMIVRGAPLGEMGATAGAAKVLGALAHVDSDMRDLLLLEGTSEIMTGFLLMDPNTSIARNFFVDFPADAVQTPQVAFQLSDAGMKAIEASGLSAGKTMVASELDWNKAIEAVELSALLAQAKGLKDISTFFHECGWSCWSYLVMGNGLQIAKVLQKSNELEKMVDESFQLNVLRELSKAQFQLDERGLLSVTGNSASDWSTLQLSTPTPARTEAERCMRAAWAEARDNFSKVAGTAAGSRAQWIKKAQDALAKNASCASQDPIVQRRHDQMVAFANEVASRIKAPAAKKPQAPKAPALATDGLSKEQIRREIRKHLISIQACYSRSQTKDPGLKGVVTLNLVVDPKGGVSSAKASGMKDKPLLTCIEGVAKTKMTFPEIRDARCPFARECKQHR